MGKAALAKTFRRFARGTPAAFEKHRQFADQSTGVPVQAFVSSSACYGGGRVTDSCKFHGGTEQRVERRCPMWSSAFAWPNLDHQGRRGKHGLFLVCTVISGRPRAADRVMILAFIYVDLSTSPAALLMHGSSEVAEDILIICTTKLVSYHNQEIESRDRCSASA